ncbi:uncharacterized protein KQ657_002658 [Scheffersomyces spartinae]|uniref:Uncharacterized protein n=1 Tax=Scheffersomyces spartinae TaxID=45513 RepID=A0A9P7V6L5_9ASCO|nr:uncharacterized protein KQ657_002658 [Scheffersomyces spartinae]KAG7191869.1 hypothetical protein KQ657_002658 [Scheffersomyces spartinae]
MGTIRFGGKSGLLPKVRPVFKHHPVKPKTHFELAQEKNLEQGYADNVPLPEKKGFTFYRKPKDLPVMSVEERIKKYIDSKVPQDIDESKLSENEIWQLKRDEIRREHLREAYLKEFKRLEKIDKLKELVAHKENERVSEIAHEESEAYKLTLPTVSSFINGRMMQERSPEQQALVDEQRILNRKSKQLEVAEKRATELLELYHSANGFITTEEELEQAIKEAFEVNVSKFERNMMNIDNKLSGYSFAYAQANTTESIIFDEVFGEIKGQPGLEVVKDTLDGTTQTLKQQAQVNLNEKI